MGGAPRPLELLPTASPPVRSREAHDSASEAGVDATADRPPPQRSLTARLRGLAVDASVRGLLASAPLLTTSGRRTPAKGERLARSLSRNAAPRPAAARPLSLEPAPRPGTRHTGVQTDDDAMGIKRRAPLSPLQAPAASAAPPPDEEPAGAAKPAAEPLERAPSSPMPALSPAPEPVAEGGDPAEAYRALLARVNAARAARAAAGPPVLTTVAAMSQAEKPASGPADAAVAGAGAAPPGSPARPRALCWASQQSPARPAGGVPPSPASGPPRSQAPAPPVALPHGGVDAVWHAFARQQAAADWADAVAALAVQGGGHGGDGRDACTARPDPVKLFCVEQPFARAPGEYYRSFLAASYPALLARYFPPAPVPTSATTPARPPPRHVYEVLREGRPCHAYFDLEFSRAANPAADGDAMVDAVVAAFLAEAAPLAGREAATGAEVYESDSSTDAKFSRHLVIRLPGVAWASTGAMGALARALLSRDSASSLAVLKPPPRNAPPGAPPTRDSIVDTAVYTKNRHFRVLWASKGGKAAVLAPTGRHAFGAGGVADRSATPLATMFLASLAGNVAPGTKLLDFGGGGGGFGGGGRPLARRSVALTHPTRPRDAIKFEWKVDEEDVSDRRHAPPADVAAAAVAAAAWVEATASARSAAQPGAPPGATLPVADHTALVRSITVCGAGGALVAYGLAGEREEGGGGSRRRKPKNENHPPPTRLLRQRRCPLLRARRTPPREQLRLLPARPGRRHVDPKVSRPGLCRGGDAGAAAANECGAGARGGVRGWLQPGLYAAGPSKTAPLHLAGQDPGRACTAPPHSASPRLATATSLARPRARPRASRAAAAGRRGVLFRAPADHPPLSPTTRAPKPAPTLRARRMRARMLCGGGAAGRPRGGVGR